MPRKKPRDRGKPPAELSKQLKQKWAMNRLRELHHEFKREKKEKEERKLRAKRKGYISPPAGSFTEEQMEKQIRAAGQRAKQMDGEFNYKEKLDSGEKESMRPVVLNRKTIPRVQMRKYVLLSRTAMKLAETLEKKEARKARILAMKARSLKPGEKSTFSIRIGGILATYDKEIIKIKTTLGRTMGEMNQIRVKSGLDEITQEDVMARAKMTAKRKNSR